MDYLVFRLYGPLASWGEIAVGETRRSALYPGRSALLGLLGAALGIRREDEKAQQALAGGYQFGCKLLNSGSLLRDYHTTQVPDSVGKQAYRTRRDELITGAERLGTILSSRDYRCDSKLLVAIQATAQAPHSLAELAEALRRPKFQLSLGRKACVLAAPVMPEPVQADDLKSALDSYPHTQLLAREWDDQRWLPGNEAIYTWEGEHHALSAVEDLSTAQQLSRYDQPVSRRRWQFAPASHWYWQAPQQKETAV
ncbi:MAG: type I-E CRISPR-associated protein Cas5/CasD [Marinobacterium sp.]|nr:type I-E CRISPR-associated protein Cas5/CasD [Marinobacterium sp.]